MVDIKQVDGLDTIIKAGYTKLPNKEAIRYGRGY